MLPYLVLCPVVLVRPLEVLEDELDSAGDRLGVVQVVRQHHEHRWQVGRYVIGAGRHNSAQANNTFMPKNQFYRFLNIPCLHYLY